MVAAILEGRKTVTRRTTGLDYINSLGDKVTFAECEMGENMTYNPPCPPGLHVFFGNEETDDWWQPIKCPYGNVGDVLWVREEHYRFGHWEPVPDTLTITGRQKWMFIADTKEVLYSDNPPSEFRGGRHHKDPHTPAWYKRLARFMYYEHCRLFLEITDIKVERLQDITEEDAVLEGAEPAYHRCGGFGYYEAGGEIQDCNCQNFIDNNPEVEGFKNLWESINGPGSWKENPFVWVVSFKRIPKPTQ